MREILFRGKCLDDGEWVQGYFVTSENYHGKIDHYIFTPNEVARGLDIGGYLDCCKMVEVIPETVGEFTGRLDKYKKKVFEGDIVKARITSPSGAYWGVWEVACHDRHCYFYLKKPNNNLLFDGDWRYGVTKIEIIGNIHDNPELLEG